MLIVFRIEIWNESVVSWYVFGRSLYKVCFGQVMFKVLGRSWSGAGRISLE